MELTGTLHTDEIHQVLADREHMELRFRSTMITSTALHTGVTLAILLAPLFVPRPVLFELTPVNLVELAPQPEPAPPAPAVEEASAAEPEDPVQPEEIEPPPPEDVPEDLEAQRRKEEEEEAQRREEERRRQEELEAQRRAAEEAARRRREEEERRRREEEERRRAPQKATRRQAAVPEPQETMQQAQRGQVGLSLSNETGTVSAQDQTLLQFWIDRVLANIATKWDPPSRPAGSREILAVISFRVGRNGQIIVDPDTYASSGNRRYDDAAVRAILAGQPFPPLPQAYGGNTLGIRIGFRQ